MLQWNRRFTALAVVTVALAASVGRVGYYWPHLGW